MRFAARRGEAKEDPGSGRSLELLFDGASYIIRSRRRIDIIMGTGNTSPRYSTARAHIHDVRAEFKFVLQAEEHQEEQLRRQYDGGLLPSAAWPAPILELEQRPVHTTRRHHRRDHSL